MKVVLDTNVLVSAPSATLVVKNGSSSMNSLTSTACASRRDVSVPRPRDADDWMVLATFVAGQGDWLVTGHADLLALAQRFPIIPPAQFVERFLV